MKFELNRAVIDELLKEFNIADTTGAYVYLLCTYHGLNPIGLVDLDTMKQVNLTKIAVRDYNLNKVHWLVDLYVIPERPIEVERGWQWVLDSYRKLWMDIAGMKGGDRLGCINKMKAFFAANPEVRKDDVMEAATLYTERFTKGENPKYMIQADYFISKKVEGTKQSMLDQVLDMIKINKKDSAEQSNRYSGRVK